MKDQLKTIRHHLEPLANNSGVRKALTALSELEAMVGQQEPVAWGVYWGLPPTQKNSVHFDKGSAQAVANQIKSATEVRPLYAAPPAQQQYEAGDMASAHNDGFRAGVASVAQQPQAEAHKPLFADLIAQHPGLRGELKAMDEQPQAEAVHCTRADLDRAYSAGLVEGERLAPQQAEAVPPGYVLVPVEPTQTMIDAMQSSGWMPANYRAMIAAAQGEKP